MSNVPTYMFKYLVAIVSGIIEGFATCRRKRYENSNFSWLTWFSVGYKRGFKKIWDYAQPKPPPQQQPPQNNYVPVKPTQNQQTTFIHPDIQLKKTVVVSVTKTVQEVEVEIRKKQLIINHEFAIKNANLAYEQAKQSMEMLSKQFEQEQARLNKEQQYKQEIELKNIELRLKELELNHALQMATLNTQVEIQKLQNAANQNPLTDKLLLTLQQFREQEQTFAHNEQLKKYELDIKQFERDVAMIRTLSEDKQQVAYQDLQNKLFERLQSYNTPTADIKSDAF